MTRRRRLRSMRDAHTGPRRFSCSAVQRGEKRRVPVERVINPELHQRVVCRAGTDRWRTDGDVVAGDWLDIYSAAVNSDLLQVLQSKRTFNFTAFGLRKVKLSAFISMNKMELVGSWYLNVLLAHALESTCARNYDDARVSAANDN